MIRSMSRTVAALAGAAVMALATVAGSAPAQAATADFTFSPKILPAQTTDLANPLRGQYQWMGYGNQPAGWPGNDIYYRDQVYWGRIEKTKDVYNLAPFEDLLNRAGANKGKAGFRVMAYCPGCWMNYRTDKDNWPQVTPSWLPLQAGNDNPDWNSEVFLSQWEDLMKVLGDKYRDDPRLGYVDVGGYGKYGEWHTDVNTTRPTDASMKRIVAAVAKNFPKKWVVINTMTAPEFTKWAVDTYPNMGMRTDNLGCPDMYSMVPSSPILHDVWKTRPFITEWCTRADMAVAKDQVTKWHLANVGSGNYPATSVDTATELENFKTAVRSSGYKYRLSNLTIPAGFGNGTAQTVSMTFANEGSTPTYETIWRPNIIMKNLATGKYFTFPQRAYLNQALPGSRTFNTSISYKLPSGTYSVFYDVRDSTGYSPRMQLNNYGQQPNGTYYAGSFVVS